MIMIDATINLRNKELDANDNYNQVEENNVASMESNCNHGTKRRVGV